MLCVYWYTLFCVYTSLFKFLAWFPVYQLPSPSRVWVREGFCDICCIRLLCNWWFPLYHHITDICNYCYVLSILLWRSLSSWRYFMLLLEEIYFLSQGFPFLVMYRSSVSSVFFLFIIIIIIIIRSGHLAEITWSICKKITAEFVRLIFQDKCWIVQIPFRVVVSMRQDCLQSWQVLFLPVILTYNLSSRGYNALWIVISFFLFPGLFV